MNDKDLLFILPKMLESQNEDGQFKNASLVSLFPKTPTL
jgi:hypothetical protein